ncbi:MAG: BsaWI family type II restriction enzyme [Atribacterota bacterium]
MTININKEFEKFIEIHQEKAFLKLSLFLNEFRIKYEQDKIDTYKKEGFSIAEAHKKSRNSWVAHVGNQLENLVILFIEKFCSDNRLKLIKGSILKRNKLSGEKSLVKRKIMVHFGEYSLLPDADIIIYKKCENDIKIIAILSVKNSFRERYTETPYWKLKLMEDEITRSIKVFMVTPDNDDEVSYIREKGPRQARIVMEYELDSIYLARENFDSSKKVKGLDQLLNDLAYLI